VTDPVWGEDDIIIRQNSTYTMQVQYYTDETETSLVPAVGWTARFEVKAALGGPTLLALALGSGITQVAGVGDWTAEVTDEQALALPVGDALYEFRVVSSGGKAYTLAAGRARVVGAVITT